MLDLVHTRQLRLIKAPLQVWIASQCPATGARRVDQHPIALAIQALDADVRLVANDDRVHIRQATALKPWTEARKPFLIDIEGIQAARRAHQCPKRERLAAGASAEVDHHFPASWLHK